MPLTVDMQSEFVDEDENQQERDDERITKG